MISNPDSLGLKDLSLWMPKFSVSTKVTLKSALSQRPELKEFFSEGADYSRMARQQVKVQEIHHTVKIAFCQKFKILVSMILLSSVLIFFF